MKRYTKQAALATLAFLAVACDQGRPGCPNCQARAITPSVKAVHEQLAGQIARNTLEMGYALLPELNVSHSLQEHMLNVQEQYNFLDGCNALNAFELNK